MYPSISLPALWNRLGRLPGEMGEMMGSLASKPRDLWLRSFPYPLVNVREEADAFYIEAEVPGLTQEQIDLHIRHGVELTLQGERKPAGGDSGAWLHRERGDGRFQRVLTLPLPVDAAKVQAKLEYGVLRIVLPKSESVRAHRIPVQGANGG